MKIDKLVAAVASTVVDEQKIRTLENRLKLVEDRFKAEARVKRVKDDFLSRAYSL